MFSTDTLGSFTSTIFAVEGSLVLLLLLGVVTFPFRPIDSLGLSLVFRSVYELSYSGYSTVSMVLWGLAVDITASRGMFILSA